MDKAFLIAALQAKIKRPFRQSYGGKPYNEIFEQLRADKTFAGVSRNNPDDISLAENILGILLTSETKRSAQPQDEPAEEKQKKEKKAEWRPKLDSPSQTKNTTPEPEAFSIPLPISSFTKTVLSKTLIFIRKSVGKYISLSGFVSSIEKLVYPNTSGLSEHRDYSLGPGSNIPNRNGFSLFSTGGFNFFKGRALIIFFIILFIILLIGMLSGPITTPSNTPSDITSGNINTCQFTRSDQNPKEASFKSPLLLGYIEEASRLTGIPLVVLAGFIRVESPSSVNFTDEQTRSYKCAISPTGALGIMQIQPAGTRGHDAPAVTNGADFLGLDYQTLTQEDYCDVRKNIILGAGFILKKMSYLKFGDGTKWDPSWTRNQNAIYALAESYYGCLNYGGSNPLKCDGPYNYGQDVWSSVLSCQQGAPPSSAGFTNPEGFVYYCQGDPRWDNKSGCGIGQIGCGPTSLAMVFSSLGKAVTPDQMYQTFSSQNRINCAVGSYMETILQDRAWMRDQGFEVGPRVVANGNLDLPRAKQYLAEGYLIVGSSQTFPSYISNRTFPHIFVVNGVNIEDKTFSIRDPANCDYSTGVEVVSRQIKPANGIGGLNWAYAYPIKRIR
ncbi:C39 family peptidase [Candidatus Daviesbacteria bacterium]|nr:C39 family peptidase [Candidatus Daviesbacteria bacterium]